ncbi:HET-domain-containing protein [Ganoderma leucocontextum]|nr:HET-domain-containing protein [Ganoderma leucocontextum]
MRLLDTKTGQFVDHNPHTDIYAILSHTWVPEGEQTYQELQAIQRDYGPDGRRLPAVPPVSSHPTPATASNRSPPATNYRTPQPSSIWDDPRLSSKIRRACETAHGYGFRYVWIDSCCIDKTNSSEWSEAINSMYAWYRDAKVCYAYLADVPTCPPRQNPHFEKSRWFTRGWTLQELIAPPEVVFLSEEWRYLGTKYSLASFLEKITGIDRGVLKHEVSLDLVSVAKRMSWASKRETTRLEDEAYSLLGIFDIYMPTLYGEGRRAFRRLQEEILRRIPDQSLLAWGNPERGPEEDRPPFLSSVGRPPFVNASSLFATSPRDFHASGSITPFIDHDSIAALLGGIDVPVQDYVPSPYGTRTQLPLLSLSNKLVFDPEDYDFCIAILACTDQQYGDLRLLGRLCVVQRYNSPSSKLHRLYATNLSVPQCAGPCGLFVLPPPQILKGEDLLRHIRVQTVYLPHPDRELPPHKDEDFEYWPPRDLGDEGGTKVRFPEWAADRLRAQGYDVNVIARTDDPRPDGALITLSKGADTLTIAYQYWVNTQLEPRGELRFVAIIYLPERQSPSRSRTSLSRSRHVTPARECVPYSIMTLRAPYGERSCNDIVLLPLADGREAALRVVLELVSAACYHLRLSIESDTPRSEDETTTEPQSDPESDESRFVLRTGVIRIGSP